MKKPATPMRRGTLLFQNFVALMLVTLGVLVLYVILTTARISGIVRDQDSDYDDRIFQLVSERIESHIRGLEQLSAFAFSNENQDLMRELVSFTPDAYNTLEFYKVKSAFFANFDNWLYILNSQQEIQRVFLVDKDGEIIERGQSTFLQDYDFRETDLFQRALRSSGQSVYEISPEDYVTRYGSKNDRLYLSIARKITISESQGQYILLYINVNLDRIDSIIDSAMGQDYLDFFILDSDSTVLYSTKNQYTELLATYEIGDGRTTLRAPGGGQVALNSYRFYYAGWYFVTVSGTSNLARIHEVLLSNVAILTGVAIVLAFVLALVLSRFMAKPIQQLVGHTKRIREGDFSGEIQVKGPAEILYLSDALNRMTKKLNETINHNYRLQMREKEARWDALQAQINPHFLYNTLNTISLSAEIADLPELAEATQALSDMFRYSIQSTSLVADVRRELEHVQNYLRIQNLRYDNTLRLALDVPEDLLGHPMIKFVLQPLVENAVLHGLEGEAADKRITIRARTTPGALVFEVANNGTPISSERLAEVQAMLRSPVPLSGETEQHTSIGLRNVHERLRLHYGEDSGLSLESGAYGTRVTVTMQFDK